MNLVKKGYKYKAEHSLAKEYEKSYYFIRNDFGGKDYINYQHFDIKNNLKKNKEKTLKDSIEIALKSIL